MLPEPRVMPLKQSGPATNPRIIDRWDGGVGWIAYPDETMQRASHALVIDGEVWLIDPVDAAGIDALFAEFGPVAGVILLLDRHTRDAASLANRHDVPVYLPAQMSNQARRIDAPIERFTDTIGSTGISILETVDMPFWHEIALQYDETLVVGDALGTADYFRTTREAIGVHPFLRVRPPRPSLQGVAPDRILVGHGEGILSNAEDALATALAGARREMPRLYVSNLKRFLLPTG